MGKGTRNREARSRTVPTATGAMEISGTGVFEEVPAGHRTIEDKHGEHLWVLMATWAIDITKFDPTTPGSGAGILDHENMLSITGPGCLKCEGIFTPELAAEPCTGSLTDLMP